MKDRSQEKEHIETTPEPNKHERLVVLVVIEHIERASFLVSSHLHHLHQGTPQGNGRRPLYHKPWMSGPHEMPKPPKTEKGVEHVQE